MTIHIVMMGKGGVGKSLVSTLLAEYLKETGSDLYCADTDPLTPTFHEYNAIGAEHISIMAKDSSIDKRKFDKLFEKLLVHTGDSVVDTGATNFIALMEYLLQADIFGILAAHGKPVIVHAPLAGGSMMEHTLQGLDYLSELKATSLVVWENENWGPIIKNGKTFGESKFYEDIRARVIGIVKIAERTPDTFGHDMKTMITKRLTFAEALDSPDFQTFSRSRLGIVRMDVFEQLEKLAM